MTECVITTATNGAAPASSIEPPPQQFNFPLAVYRTLREGVSNHEIKTATAD
jgi:hypothetical protein